MTAIPDFSHPLHDADGTQKSRCVVDQVKEHHNRDQPQHPCNEGVELVDDLTAHPGQHPHGEQQGEDEITDGEPDRVVPQQRRRDDPWRVLPACDLNRHEQRTECEYEERKV